jgi:hypothetical protein
MHFRYPVAQAIGDHLLERKLIRATVSEAVGMFAGVFLAGHGVLLILISLADLGLGVQILQMTTFGACGGIDDAVDECGLA